MDQRGFQSMMDESGFKVLAVARMESCEYSVMLYLLNCAVSGLDQFLTTETELASLIGYTPAEIEAALGGLTHRNMVRVRYSQHAAGERNSIRIGIQYDTARWRVDSEAEVPPNDAIVFPFRRQGQSHFQIVAGAQQDSSAASKQSAPTWRRIVDAFVSGRSLDDDEITRAEESAAVLVETHPVDQVLLMIRHFGRRIPTLSLLASSWQHYQEMFEQETQRVDMQEARQKHVELDEKVREHARTLLHAPGNLELTTEEKTVLEILIKHRHPRRQLFWAYQVRGRYQNLEAFFNDNAPLMLPVTTTGAVLKKLDT